MFDFYSLSIFFIDFRIYNIKFNCLFEYVRHHDTSQRQDYFEVIFELLQFCDLIRKI